LGEAEAMSLSISGIEGPAAVPAIERLLPGPWIGNANAILPMITVAGVSPFHSDEIDAELSIIRRTTCSTLLEGIRQLPP